MSYPQEAFAVHTNPIWRDRADFVINGVLPENSTTKKFEQLWVRRLTDDQFEVCCIPFFVYDLALGDTVRAATMNGRAFVVDSVVNRSGRCTFRVWFGQSFRPRAPVVSELEAMGALTEWSSRNMVAVDAADDDLAERVADFLWDQEQAEALVYETGRTT